MFCDYRGQRNMSKVPQGLHKIQTVGNCTGQRTQFLQKKKNLALAGVAQWIERWSANQGVAGLIPSQGTCLRCRPAPQLGARERQPHIDVSLLSLSIPSSKNK